MTLCSRKYDHFVFPGAVPRTFVGSILLAWLSKAFVQTAAWLDMPLTKFELQITGAFFCFGICVRGFLKESHPARLILAAANAIGLQYISHAVSNRFGHVAGVHFVLLTCSQFHLPFWMGRTLPNMFALIPGEAHNSVALSLMHLTAIVVNLAWYFVLDQAPNARKPSPAKFYSAVALLVFTTVVFRAEVLLILGPFVLHALWSGYATFMKTLHVVLISGLISLGKSLRCPLR